MCPAKCRIPGHSQGLRLETWWGNNKGTRLTTSTLQIAHINYRGPFIIYDRGWAGKIQLTTKQNVLPPASQKIQ
jgi:hypothetical protein